MYVLLSCCLHFKEIINPDIQMILKGKSELGSSAEVLSLDFVQRSKAESRLNAKLTGKIISTAQPK